MMHHLVKAIERLEKALRQKDVPRLKELSKDFIRSSALSNDRSFSKLSMIAYSLNKLVLRKRILENPRWPKAEKMMLKELSKAAHAAERNDARRLEERLDMVTEHLNSVDEELGRYVQSLEEKARVKMASNAYAFGLSLASAASLTGADIKEVQNYVGWTKMHDEEGVTLGIAPRLKKLREVI